MQTPVAPRAKPPSHIQAIQNPDVSITPLPKKLLGEVKIEPNLSAPLDCSEVSTQASSGGATGPLKSGRPFKRSINDDISDSLSRKKARAIRNRLAAKKSRECKKAAMDAIVCSNEALVEENERLKGLLERSEIRRNELEKKLNLMLSFGEPLRKHDFGYSPLVANCLSDYCPKSVKYDASYPDISGVNPYGRPPYMSSSASSDTMSCSGFNASGSDTCSYNGDLCESAVLVQLCS
ncbi:hypothetical protein AYI68_g6211 [Smittium mucronatum]|uniref:BZIP domain-containing protein n=1 Tax=Smittium mucronatum TaxID=133383 RepID=A0A1R0GS39_9FUNG|nr:hypothetical protein AYI68_g6211 [Smittium mucronatum]